jgi:hypothetical protein
VEGSVVDLCPLTVAEARAILIADDVLALSFAVREAHGLTFGIAELDAWLRLVESAKARIAAYERAAPAVVIAPYPGGNEPDFQTLAVEAAAASAQRMRKTP